MTASMPAGALAAAFEPASSIYLLSHSVGRLPLSTRQRVEDQFFAPWAKGASEPWPQWLAAVDEFRGALAGLLGAAADNFCPQTNLSGALSRVLGSLPPVAGRETILLSEDDFPSTGYVLQQAMRLGYQLRYLPAGAEVFDPQVWLDHIDDSVGMVFITHVQSNSGRRAAVAPLLAELRRREIVSIVDIAQSAGIIPLDLEAWGADFVIGSCVKWLCGGPGAGYLWVNPSILPRCEPLDIGWFSHADPFEFDIYQFRYHPGALRFWGGTPSVLPYITAANGLALLARAGVDNAYAHNRAMREILLVNMDEKTLVSPLAEALCGGTLIVHAGDRHDHMVALLTEAGVAFDQRAAGVRLSPHVYNSAEDIQRVAACLAT